MPNHVSSVLGPDVFMSKPFGIGVPDYSRLGILKPYFGDAVWEYLKQIDKHGFFEYIPIEVIPFPDTAEKCLVGENVREKDVVVVHSLYTPAGRHTMLGAQFADALMRSDARTVHLFDLFNPYFTQDTRKDRESITAALVASLYHASGVNTVYTADPHSKHLSGFFKKMEPLPMSRRLAKCVREKYDISNAVVASADTGSTERSETFANILDLPMVRVRKRRVDEKTVVVEEIVGDYKNKDVFLRDDVIRTGNTTSEDAKVLRAGGARRIVNVATHLELCGNAKERLYAEGVEIVGTNSVPVNVCPLDEGRMTVVDVSDIIAKVIYRKCMRGSLREFFSEQE